MNQMNHVQMIYLIFTTSLITKKSITSSSTRSEEYRSAITQTLSFLPALIQPVIVENNGKRTTFLDQFTHHGRPIPIVYTDHNQLQTKSKGVNEVLDLHAVIEEMNIQPNDLIIKLTGRYRATSASFFESILQDEKRYDAFIKFYGVTSLCWETYDCVLGCFAARAFYLKSWNPYSIENYRSAEIAFAKYIRLSGARIKEVDTLYIRCHFAEDGRMLDV